MKKRYLLPLLVPLALAAFFLPEGEPDEPAPEVTAESGDSAAAMSVRGMEIHQGEDGVELWRLKAEGAVMSQQGGDIVAQKPFLTYYIRGESGEAAEETSILTVESLTGDVNQKENRIRFVGEVLVKHEDDALATGLILYTGDENILECPEPSVLTRPGMRGEAAHVVWRLDDNILQARRGVDIDLETDRAPGAPLMPGASLEK